LTATDQSDFGGVINTDDVGVMGDSYGAYTTLALTGARIDPSAASAATAKPLVASGLSDADPRALWSDWSWDAMIAYRATLAPALTSDALWPAFTDSRIHAALMISPCWETFFGEHGLAAATVPSLIVGGTADDVCRYPQDDVETYAHLGSSDRFLVSIIGAGHVPGGGERVITQLETAFLEYYLKGQQDDAQYLTAQYVNSVEAQLKRGLVWGPYTGG